eukprot:Sdes_comp11741_c0_seq1m2830
MTSLNIRGAFSMNSSLNMHPLSDFDGGSEHCLDEKITSVLQDIDQNLVNAVASAGELHLCCSKIALTFQEIHHHILVWSRFFNAVGSKGDPADILSSRIDVPPQISYQKLSTPLNHNRFTEIQTSENSTPVFPSPP